MLTERLLVEVEQGLKTRMGVASLGLDLFLQL